MKPSIRFLTISLLIVGCKSSNTAFDKSKTAIEIQQFMDNYSVMLQTNIKNVGNLYYDSGAIFSQFGNTIFLPLDTIKSDYEKRSNMAYFEWRDIKIDPLTEDLALVTSIFYEHNPGKLDTSRFAYTGLFVRTSNGWKIKHEHESIRPKK